MNTQDQLPELENCLLIRESLDDVGGVLHGNFSPDIVVRRFTLSDPLQELTETYNKDISEDKIQERTMYVYVRFKNISDQPLENFYIHVYRNHLGLYNNPKEWNKYKLATDDRKPSVISGLEPGAIGVSKAFVFDSSKDGKFPNCLIAVATYEKDPDFSYIDSYEKYIAFADQKNVSARNVCEIIATDNYTEQDLHFRTSDTKKNTYYFIAEAEKNTSPGVTYGIKCTHPYFSEHMVYDPKNKSAIVVKETLSGNCEYTVTLWAEIPKGGEANIIVRMLVEASENELMDHAVDISDILKDNCIGYKAPVVVLGDCTIRIDGKNIGRKELCYE